MLEMSSISLPLVVHGFCVLNHGVHADVAAGQELLVMNESSCLPNTLDEKRRILFKTRISIIVPMSMRERKSVNEDGILGNCFHLSKIGLKLQNEN